MNKDENIESILSRLRKLSPEIAASAEKFLGVKTVTTMDCKVCGRKNRIKPERLVHRCGYCKALLR